MCGLKKMSAVHFALAALLLAGAVPANQASKDHDRPAISGGGAGGDGASSCSTDAITRGCDLFNPEIAGATIPSPFGDGTVIPNYAYYMPGRKHPTDPERLAHVREKIFADLSSLPAGSVSNRFRHFLSGGNAETVLRGVLGPVTGAVPSTDPDAFVRLPWPPGDDEAALRLVRVSEVRATLTPLLGERMNEIKSLVAVYTQGPADPRFGEHPPNAVTPDRGKRIEELFAIAKEKMIVVLTHGKPVESCTEAVRNAVAKIKAVKLAPQSAELANNPACRGATANAYYSPATVDVSVCPSMYAFPDETVVAALGHELGHAIDPCGGQCPVCTAKRDALAAAAPETANDPEADRLRKSLMGLTGPTGTLRAAMPLAAHFTPAAVARLRALGVLQEEVPATPFKDYALLKEYKCLQTPSGGSFPAVSEEEAATAPMPECNADGRTQLTEAVPDLLGSRIMGLFMKDQQARGRKYDTPAGRLSAIAFFASIACMNHYNGNDEPALRSAHARLTPVHPGPKKRLDDIFLRDPNVRKVLGCGPDGGAC